MSGPDGAAGDRSERTVSTTVAQGTAGLAATVRDLEELAQELRAPRARRVPPAISAASDALTCAALLLRAQQDTPGTDVTRADLLHDALALARSTVETVKIACREHRGTSTEGAGARAGVRG
ncbi:hypothetical protein [Streptomyces sp. CRN 30]|uniref:hypothetical protein n=1 Tax=Streptomyces sp. CRN 30 TaxID=3075613 RepID=UPI002A840724|nr:hypothetical protein [Streptomyces sp. CRN 30]